MDIIKSIASSVVLDGVSCNIADLITEVQDKANGDYCIPCFSLSKELKKSPIQIANEIKDNFRQNGVVDRIEVVNGYVNFFLNKGGVIERALSEVNLDIPFAPRKEYKNKVLCIDYSSANLAKYMHIGHLSTTIIGETLARLHEALGYKVVRINYIGDYGTPFGKMVYAYIEWGNADMLEKRGVDYIQELYIEFYKRSESDPALIEQARECFKKIDQKESDVHTIYQKFIEISKQEAKSILDKLGVQFDSWKGESAYSDELSNVVKMIEAKSLLKASDGALVVDLEPYDLGTCLIQKSDGTSLYATRDIAAALDRYKAYKFDKMLYVTGSDQRLHFKQFFKVLELLGNTFSRNLTHVDYGLFSLPTGKISSRRGKQAVLRDLMEYSYQKAFEVVKNRDYTQTQKEDIASKIALSALKYNAIKTERVKDSVFDIENCFSFDGDTSAYMQYTYARISSVLRKAGYVNQGKVGNQHNIDYSYLNSPEVFNIVFLMNNYAPTLDRALANNEPSTLSKFAMELCKLTNKFYASEKVITDDKASTNAKLFLLSNILKTLEHIFYLICIDIIKEM